MIHTEARAHVLAVALATLLALFSCRVVAVSPGGPVTQVATGFEFTCVLSASGGVACFGQNDFGQLGDNSVIDRHSPVAVTGLGSGVVAIGAGQSHACALTSSGGVKCWGANYSGQLGDNSTTQRLTPVDVFGLTSGVAAIAVAPLHTCALTVGGGMKCWGNGIALGDGVSTSQQRNAPVDVAGLTSGVVAIGAGGFNSCAIIAGGRVQCWGGNLEGELGDNSTAFRALPGNVSGLLSGVAAIAVGGSHVCALMTAGGAKCWGSNLNGQVGNNSLTNQLTPADVVGLSAGVAAITAGAAHTCAVLSGGYLKCWGYNNSGQLGNGDGTGANQFVPVDFRGLANVVAAVSGGGHHTCARTQGGNVACWGDGYYGQLGDGTGTSGNLPVGVSGFSTNGVAQLALGESHTCALTLAGGVKCWGFNAQGELGNNTVVGSLSPVDVSGLTSGVAYIDASKFHTCAVTATGGVKCWGQNTSGSLGDGTQVEKHVPNDVFGLASGFAAVTTGSNHSCALTAAGAAVCWGGNSLGVLGDGTYNQQLFPVSVLQSSPYVAISAGDSVTCAVVFGGVVQCWGANNAGQLGLGGVLPTKTNTPGNVPGLPDNYGMDAGGSHTCVLTPVGGVKCWGSNLSGELGDGTMTSPRPSPNDVAGLTSGIIGVTAGTVHSCALTTAGGVKCWGDNFFGELGDGSSTGRAAPVDVVGLASGIADVVAGVGHTCAITTAGGVKCWGHNLDGQLGDNSQTNRVAPVVALIGGQSINFTPPAYLQPGVSTTLSAVASSGLAVTFDTWTPAVCSVNGNTVTASAQGLCGLRASQGGNGSISPAPQALRVVPVVSTPNAFAFVDQSNVFTNTSITSAPVTITGLSAPATVSVGGGSYSVGCTATFTSVPGTITNNQTICVNHVSAGSAGAAVDTVLTVGGLSDTFTSTTAPNNVTAQVASYYRSILRREADAGGLAYWQGEAVRMQSLGANVNEAWFAMAIAFFNSAEYRAFNRDDPGFVTDLYNTFFNRPPDTGGFNYWLSQVAAGMPRQVVLLSFMFSPEFISYTQGLFGNTAARAEIDAVGDFYRGLLNRLPDTGGFNYWVGRFRTAQCTGSAAVNAEVESISSQFANSAEYVGRSRANIEFVSDLYNSFLRRGGDLAGVQFWVNQLNSFVQTRDQLRRAYVGSPEFQARVAAIVAQGCVH